MRNEPRNPATSSADHQATYVGVAGAVGGGDGLETAGDGERLQRAVGGDVDLGDDELPVNLWAAGGGRARKRETARARAEI